MILLPWPPKSGDYRHVWLNTQRLVLRVNFVLFHCTRGCVSLVKAVTLVVTSSRTLSMVYHGTDESHVLKGIFVNEDVRTLAGQKDPGNGFLFNW